MKKLLIFIIVLAVVGGVVYFITSKKPQEEGSRDSISERNQARVFQYENLPAGTLEDLVIGEKVVVMGIENQDGSITATMLSIGTLEDRSEFSPNTERDFSHRPASEEFDPEGFRNLSQGERMERMREMRDSGEMPSMEGGAGRMRGGAAFVRGEIIDKDEMSITVELVEGGSKLVFYSDSTQILKREE
jgi:hypothetical protein